MFMLFYSPADICGWRRNRNSSLTFTKSKKLKKKNPQMTTLTTDQGFSMNGILFLWNSLILPAKASNTTQRFKLWCRKYPRSIMSAGVPLAG